MLTSPFAQLLLLSGSPRSVAKLSVTPLNTEPRQDPIVRLLYRNPTTPDVKALHGGTLSSPTGIKLPNPLPFRQKSISHIRLTGASLHVLFLHQPTWTHIGTVPIPSTTPTRKAQKPLVDLNTLLATFEQP